MRRFLALSRSRHGILDVAMPGFVALLWLGRFPPWPVLLLSLLTAFAGYTAIYALNDLVGVKVDREKFAAAAPNRGYSVEASDLRYPLARNLLSVRSAMAWFVSWFVLALIGAYLLNPLIVLIAIAAGVLELVYCKLLQVTYWRILVSGLVKSAGPIAAVFVVAPEPSVRLLFLLLAWLICWEIGGQNIPADWNDIEEDKRIGAKTIPLAFGPQVAGTLIVVALSLTVILGLFLPLMSPLVLGLPYLAATVAAGLCLLLLPALQLYRSHDSRMAAKLFDRASLYPLAQLMIILVFVFFGRHSH